jgi:virginiamycin B lyase
MTAFGKLLASTSIAACLASPGLAATISGKVQGADGKPVMGVFVTAENPKTNISVHVLSGADGKYLIPNLGAATYDLRIESVGWKAVLKKGIALSDNQASTTDFTVEKRPVEWSELSTWQGRQLLPKTETHDLSHKDPFFSTCFQSCHSFQNRMAVGERTAEGWLERVRYMSDGIMAGDGRKLKDDQIEDIAKYLTIVFGPDSPKPASPEKVPGYDATVHHFAPDAMNIVYVEYDFPAERGMGPWSAVEAPDGMIWVPYYGRGNEVVRLNPDTGEMTPFRLPFAKTAGIHSVYPAKDGMVWFVETSLGRIARLDPKTKEITEFQSPPTADGKRVGAHTIRVDDAGLVWVSGGPVISRFNPKTGEWKHFPLSGTYGNESAPDGSQWFTAFRDKGPIGRVKNDELTTFQPPTNGKPQRLVIDKDGTIWFTERQGNKLGHLDPATGTFKEFPLPGPEASPYAINIDAKGMIWYPSHEMDTMNRFDPKTSKVTEYPYPHAEIAMREFFVDSKGRMWYGASTNNKVGYFYLTEATP